MLALLTLFTVLAGSALGQMPGGDHAAGSTVRLHRQTDGPMEIENGRLSVCIGSNMRLAASLIGEAGRESLILDEPSDQKSYQHPGHWKEVGSTAVYLMGAVNSWVRRLRILDADECVMMEVAANCTVSDVIMGTRWRRGEPTENTNHGETGHYGIEITHPQTQDNLVTNCELQTTYVHNLSVSGFCSGNVYSSIRTPYPRFDHHGRAPYDDLYTDILLTKGGDGFHMSGGWRGDQSGTAKRATQHDRACPSSPTSIPASCRLRTPERVDRRWLRP